MKPLPVLVLGGQGYVGSALTGHLQAAGLPCRSVDLELRGSPGPLPNRRRAFQELTAEELSRFGGVVLLAGHASVAACDQAPAEAFANNVSGFVELVHRLRGQPLVFASSISVYVQTGGWAAREDQPLPPPVSYYDLHKQAIERYAAIAYPQSYALRFGTVCGPSPNLRPELLLNSMVLSALKQGEIRVANREASRPLLGIGDLCRTVEAVLRGGVPPGCYNLASVNTSIGELAALVSDRFGVPVQEVELPNRYDIRVDTGKFCRAAEFVFRDHVPGLIDSLEAAYVHSPSAAEN
jgi:nucleoside-diphosphate-sugar epimerase